jgi:GH24 family phage-related lysozyme (muramidase)
MGSCIYCCKKVEEASQIPQSGVSLIKEFEDFSPTAYYDPHTGNLPITIGWGSTRNFDGKPFKITDTITLYEANLLFEHQIKTEFLPALRRIPYWDEMNENQRGALLSFAYNLGADFYNAKGFNTISRVLRERRWDEVPKTLELYRNPGTNVEAGLLRRRKVEGVLWSQK